MELLFNFHGRINRKQFWLGLVILIIVGIVLGAVSAFLSATLGAVGRWLGFFLLLAILYPSVALTAKRLRDRGRANIRPWLFAYFAPGVVSNLAQTAGIGFTEQRFGDLVTTTPDMLGMVLIFAGFAAFVVAIVDLGFLKGQPEGNKPAPQIEPSGA